MRDRVHYQVPLGFLGRLVHPIIVRPRLEEIFSFRFKAAEELFGA
jgi:ligand-binding SRPBCC domain-containing protein